MDWLTEHLDMVMPVALVLMYLFQRMFVRGEGEGEAGGAELDEEARRIQEEIRRKIVARQRGEEMPPPYSFEETQPRPAPPVRAPEVEAPPVPMEFPRADWRDLPETPPPVMASARDLVGELREQRERLRQAKAVKEEAVSRGRSAGSTRRRVQSEVVVRASSAGNLRDQLQADLATSESLKRAFLLKEVLDQPIGLRERPDVFGNW